MGCTALFTGSFDPLTNGHVDIVLRCAHLFERIVVAVLVNAEKTPLFSAEARVSMIREVFSEYPNIEVDTFDGLLVDYVARRKASVIVRGLRAVSDFDYEFQMAQANYKLAQVETFFVSTSPAYGYLSSSLVKDIARRGGDRHRPVGDRRADRDGISA